MVCELIQTVERTEELWHAGGEHRMEAAYDGYSPTVDSDYEYADTEVRICGSTISRRNWCRIMRSALWWGKKHQGVDPQYVRKIYNESIKIESAEKDGNGAAAAYSERRSQRL